ncbi:MAG: N-acetylmuramoyl-L-alanine amidase, partial [Verrucomicrobiales bacterium]|nr:N-acetylmuramoyl-L-alanine amidase [Verrucomicrobiales bacterium]
AKDRGVKNRPGLAVTRHTHCPAVLIECGFLTNADEAMRLKTGAYRAQLARGMANGVEAYLDAVKNDSGFGIVLERRDAVNPPAALSAGR